MNNFILRELRKDKCLILLLVLFITLLTGCSKELGGGVGRGEAVLRFKVEGAQDANVISNKRSSIGNMVGLDIEESNKSSFRKGDIAWDFNSDQQSIPAIFSDNEDISQIQKKAGTKPLASGVRYRLIVYTLSDNLVASIEAKVGEEQHIAVDMGQSYKWIAFSYNTTDPMPSIDLSDPIIETPTSSTLLFAKSDNTGPINGNGYVLPIVLQHQLTQICVQIGMSTFDNFRSVTEVTAEFVDDFYVKKRNFNFLTGEMSGALVVEPTTDLTFTPLVPTSNKTMVARYYTADPTYTNYTIKVNTLKIKALSGSDPSSIRDLTASMPSSGGVQGQVTFGSFSGVNKGSVLLGDIQISLIIPQMKILAISNNNWNGGYRLGPETPSGKFLADPVNFGPNSQYVRTDGITVESITNSQGLINTKFANKANYPDILYLACDGDYLNAADWAAVKLYLQRGGTVYHGQDNTGSLATAFMRDIFGTSTGTLIRHGQDGGTYKFTDTPGGLADKEVLNGPFGDVTNYYWGNDRVGTVYFDGYDKDAFEANAIIYSNQAQNYRAITPLTTPRACYFRHKTLNYFFIGDGGFTLWYAGPTYHQFPFRTNSANFPVVEGYGDGAVSRSPAYSTVLYRSNGNFPIANSLMFGNLVNQFLTKVHYYGIDRNE